jgi:hypothetical protein
MEKKPYETPELQCIGSVQELTEFVPVVGGSCPQIDSSTCLNDVE